MRLAGKVALITGGASGIGRGICIRFAEEGAAVAVADIDVKGAEETAGEVRRLEARAIVIQADVSQRADCQRMVRETVDAFQRLDIFVGNAGIGRGAPFLDFPEEDWNAVMATNLNGMFLSCQAAAQEMVRRGHGGKIITMSSVAAERAPAGFAAYATAKAGIRMLTRVMALELAPHRINVNAIGPGIIETPLAAPLVDLIRQAPGGEARVPWGHVGQPKDVANVALFLASDESDYCTGGIIYPDGGILSGLMAL